MKIVIMIMSGVIALLIAGLFFTNCGTSRSPLITDAKIPLSCRIVLDCYYFKQKESKDGCNAVFGEGCKADLAYDFCDMRISQEKSERIKELKYNLCMAKHGK